MHPIHAGRSRIARPAAAIRAWRILDAFIDGGGDRWHWRLGRIGWNEPYGSSPPIIEKLKPVRIADVCRALV